MSFSSRKPGTIDPDKVDPSVYYYDEVYDDMKEEQESQRGSRGKHNSSSKDRHKGSKYIDGLKETADLRKTEKELRKFKRYTRDRVEAEEEGDISREDVYISNSYKRKLAEVKKLEEEKLRRHEREKDRTMNFVKNSIAEKPKSDSGSKRHKSEKVIEHSSDDRRRSPSVEPVRTDHEVKSSTEPRIERRRPKTIDERREYLREVLKKRTVGKVYDEAVQRYMQRKTLSQR